MRFALAFLSYSLGRIFSIKPSVFGIEAFSKCVLFSFFQFYSILGDWDFRLNLILLNDSSDDIFSNMLIFESGINFIKTIGCDFA